MDLIIHDNLRYTDPQYPNFKWQLRNDHILQLFGLPPNGHIPADFIAGKYIGNVYVGIFPRGQAPIKRRVIANCPVCEKAVCAGHLNQHMKVHKVKKCSS